MNRLKFLVFAVVACGVWAYGLMSAAPAFTARQAELAGSTLNGVGSAVALAVEAQRTALVHAALKTSAGAVLGAKPAKAEAPTAERFDQLRAAASGELNEGQRAQLVFGLVNEAGGRWGVGAAASTTDAPAGLDVAALSQAGGPAAVATLSGQAHLVFVVPTLVIDKSDAVRGGSAVLALPLLADPQGLVGGLVKDLQLEAVGVSTAGAAPVVAGADKALLEKALALAPGAVKAVADGPVSSVGPMKFPMFVSGATQAYGLKVTLQGAPVDVVAVTSVKPALDALAGFQKFALFGLLALLLLAGAMLALLSEASPPAMSVTAPSLPPPPMSPRSAAPAMPVSSPPTPAAPPVEAPAMSAAVPPEPAAPAMMPAPAPAAAAPEPAADSFDFGMLGQVSAKPPEKPVEPPKPPPPAPPAKPAPPPVSDSAVVALPGAAPARAPAAPPPPVSSSSSTSNLGDAIPLPGAGTPKKAPALFDDEEARTAAYPIPKGIDPKAADPFAAASAALGSTGFEADSGDSTRVAAIPQELLKAARSGAGGAGADVPKPQPSAPPPRVATAPAVAPAAFDEDRHFQDVFREFVATRERCGEPADGLTYDKFKAKLLKNKEQLVAKYACKSVRFQVYVKDNKAALKATPVKD